MSAFSSTKVVCLRDFTVTRTEIPSHLNLDLFVNSLSNPQPIASTSGGNCTAIELTAPAAHPRSHKSKRQANKQAMKIDYDYDLFAAIFHSEKFDIQRRIIIFTRCFPGQQKRARENEAKSPNELSLEA